MNYKKTTQTIAFTILGLSTLVVAAPIFLIALLIIVKGLPAITPEFLFKAPLSGMKAGGIFPAIVGSFYIIVLSIIFALPIGIASAIYLNEYAQKNLASRLIRTAIVNLAGVPSIVFGLFGFGLFVMFFHLGTSILSGSLTLAIMALPIIITATEEALKTIPQSFRDASLALGATKWQTIKKIVLPGALPGILTGAIFAIGRVAGETAPILFTVAAFYLPNLPKSLFDQAMTLPYHLYVISTQIPGVPQKMQYGTALVLMGLVLGVSSGATILRMKYRRAKKW